MLIALITYIAIQTAIILYSIRKSRPYRPSSDYDRGRMWVSHMYYTELHPIAYIQDYLDGHEDGSEFDKGAQSAINELRSR